MALGEVADLAVRLSLDDDFSRGLKGATGNLGKFESSLSRVGRGAGKLSSGLARSGAIIGTAVVGGLAGAAKAAIDFEDAFAGVKKTVDEADLAAAGLTFEDLEKSFRDMAKTIPISATEFARLGETAGALGVAVEDIDEFVETTALLGVTTNLTADEAADAFGRIGTILNLTGDDYEELADSIVALGNAGASTESEIVEITKRFAAEAKAAGLAKEDIVGLASVTASLGFAPERGGTALARVFANMGTNIALANKKGKAFAKLVGQPIEDLQDAIDRGEGLPIFLDVLEEIKGLSATEANRVLKALGVTNVSDRTIFRAMADQLPEVNRQLTIAADATGALSEEAQKRFDTVASKIAVFKNNLIDAAITIGEGMIPAIGRATEKLTAFLQEPGNVSELKNLGEDIGDAIDNIDWDEVLSTGKSLVGVMKDAFGWAKRLFDVFNALPAEIKGATVGLIALNKLSGGLIGGGLGDIAGGLFGGLGRNLGARIPGIGKAFVQPVFVTNMPVGGLGGPGAIGAAAGGLSLAATLGALGLGALAGGGAALVITRPTVDLIDPKFNQRIDAGERPLANRDPRRFDQAGRVVNQFETDVRNAGSALKTSFPLVTGGDRPSPGNPGLVAGQLAKAITPGQQATRNAIKNAQSIQSRENSAQKAELSNIKAGIAMTRQQAQAQSVAQIAAQNAAAVLESFHAMTQLFATNTQTGAVRTGAATTAAATRGVSPPIVGALGGLGSRIVGAIWAARPVIQSTTVVQKYTTSERGGASSDSRTRSGQ